MKCMNCGGMHDVTDFYVGEEQMILCADCEKQGFRQCQEGSGVVSLSTPFRSLCSLRSATTPRH
jgi:hypothetical protein